MISWKEICEPTDADALRGAIESSALWDMPAAERVRLCQARKCGDGGLVDNLMRQVIELCMQDGTLRLKNREDDTGGVESIVLMETLIASIHAFEPTAGSFLHYFRRALKNNRRKDEQREYFQMRCGMGLSTHIRAKLREVLRCTQLNGSRCSASDLEKIAAAMRTSTAAVKRYLHLCQAVNSVSLESGGEGGEAFEVSDPDGDNWNPVLRDEDALRPLLYGLVCGIEATVRAQTKQNRKLCFSYMILCLIRKLGLRDEIEPDEALLWSAMLLQYARFMVENGDSFLQLEIGRLLRELDRASLTDYSGCSRSNICDQLQKYAAFVARVYAEGPCAEGG